MSEQFKLLCDEKGNERQFTISHTPQQNGVVEKRNKTLLEMIKTMMARIKLSITYWGNALLVAAYLLSLVPSKYVPSTTYKLWT